MPKELIELELACQRAGHEGDGERLHAIWSETGFLAQPDRFRPDKLLAQFRDATWWYVLDEDIELTPEIATEVMIDMSDPRSEHFGQMRHETLPADHLFGRRVELLDARRPLPAARPRELPPHRARVDVRRAARDRARAGGGRLLPALTSRGSPGWPLARRRRASCVVASSGDLSADRVRDWVEDAGVWAPVAFVAALRVADRRAVPRAAAGRRLRACSSAPRSASRSASRAAVLGASMAFLLARTVGHDAVERRAGPRVARLRAAIGRRGFVAVLYARIVPGVPYNLVNYAAGLAPIGLGDVRRAPPRSAPPRARSPTPRSAARSTTSARPRRSRRSSCWS